MRSLQHEEPVAVVGDDARLTHPAETAHGAALDAARAEFRRAWEAKRERFQVRARKAERVQTGSIRLGVLLISCSGCVLVAGLLNGASLDEVMRTEVYRLVARSFLFFNLVSLGAWGIGVLWKRAAGRLEEAEIRYD